MATKEEIQAQIVAKQLELETLKADLQAAIDLENQTAETAFIAAVDAATTAAGPDIVVATNRIGNAVAVSESTGLPFRIIQGTQRLVYTPTTLTAMWPNTPMDFFRTHLILPGKVSGWIIR